jgi:hypothetical protein
MMNAPANRFRWGLALLDPSHPRRLCGGGVGLVLLALTLAGCKTQDVVVEPVSFAVPPMPQVVMNSAQHRVVLMPVASATGTGEAASQIQLALAEELRRSGHFEVVIARHDNSEPDARSVFDSGTFDEAALLHVYERYHGESILFVEVTQYRDERPSRLGLNVALIDPAESVVLSSLVGSWDLKDEPTQRRMQTHSVQTTNTIGNGLNEGRALQHLAAFEVSQQLVRATRRSSPE